MRNFFVALMALGGLLYASGYLQNNFQDFVKQGIDRYAPPPKNDQKIQKRNQYEPEDEKESTENLPTKTTKQLKALPTDAPNVQKIGRNAQNDLQFTYVFRDSKEKGVQFTWTGDRTLHETTLPRRFGLPRNFFDKNSPYTQKQIDNFLKKGSFKQVTLEGNLYTIPDYNKIARDNKAVTAPIYEMIRQYLGKNATPSNIIETLMTFCQDIPYKRPPAARGKRYTGELDVPAKMLTVGTGDCDTKSVFFVSALLQHPTIKTVVVLVSNPDHMFVAYRGVPTPYQAYITYQGEKYIVCEPVGNARLPIGKLGFADCKTRLVAKITP